MRGRSPKIVRDLNRSAILRLIGTKGPIARAEIARELDLSPATVTHVTRDLIVSGVIEVVDRAPSSGGRPGILLAVVGRAAHAIGVKIAADHLVGVRVNLDAEVVDRFELPFDAASDDAIDQLAVLLRPFTEPVAGGAPLLGIGLGVPGIVDSRVHGVVDSPMLGWHRAPLGPNLQEALGVPVLVDNDVNTLAVAERLYGRGRGVEHFSTVTIGRGVGLGIIAAGEIYRGARGGAGEFGHVTVAEDGPMCECGHRGCLEAVVSDPALVARARREGVLSTSGGIAELRELAAADDLTARRIFSDAGETLGRAVAALVNLLGPELVLISGEGTLAWPHMESAFRQGLARHVFPPLAGVDVEVDPWDDEKWALGAAALVLRATFVNGLDERPSDRLVRARLTDLPDRTTRAAS